MPSMNQTAPRSDATLIAPPEELPITLDQAKKHLRVDFTDDDELIGWLIETATTWIDAGQGWVGVALIEQQWLLAIDHFPYAYRYSWDDGFYRRAHQDGFWLGGLWQSFHRHLIALPYPPLISVDEIKYYDADGVLQTLDPAAYQVSGIGAERRRARLAPAPATIWPVTQYDRMGSVAIKFTCGHADAASVPATIKQAILLLIGHFYENRDAAFIAERSRAAVVELPLGVQRLLDNCRIVAIDDAA